MEGYIMTLEEFIRTKPPELRLGQWFSICYIRNDDNHPAVKRMFYESSHYKCIDLIKQLMEDWQWNTLPEREKING